MTLMNDYLNSLEPNKVSWVNKNSIRLGDVARIDKLKFISNSNNYESPVHYFSHAAAQQLLDELDNIFQEMFVESRSEHKLTFDITEIGGMAASKSNISKCGSMSHFVDLYCRPYFQVTPEDLKSNLSHDEIRIISREKTSDNICIFGWKDCLYLSNSGGSHHFATAQYIARELDIPVPLQAQFNFITINPIAVEQFNAAYTAILIPRHDFAYLSSAMSEVAANAVAYQLPPHSSVDAILLIYAKGTLDHSIDSHLKDLYTNFNNELVKFLYQQKENHQLRKYLKK